MDYIPLVLSYKTESAGRLFVKMNSQGTSQECDKALDRDYRASWNILSWGLALFLDIVSGQGLPVEPVEQRPLLRIPAYAVITG
jgi:transposase